MPSIKITRDELKSLSGKFSIKNFVADLPRMLNDAFKKIVECITDFYDPDNETLTAKRLDVTYIDATTIVAQNIKFKADNGQTFTLNDIANSISQVKEFMNGMTYITKDQIDELDSSI